MGVIEALFGLLLAVAAAGVGQQILNVASCRFSNSLELLVFSLATGFGSLMVTVLLMGLAHLLYMWVLIAVVTLWGLIGFRRAALAMPVIGQIEIRRTLALNSVYPWVILLLLIGTLFGLVRALAPPHGATDPLAYQLALPQLFLLSHHLSFEPSITGALYPHNMGMLYLVAIALRNGSLAQVIHWSMGVCCTVAVAGFCIRYFSWRAGIWAAAIFGFVPIVVYFGPLGYVDVGLCFYQFMAFWALFNWLSERDRCQLLLAAALAGLAMGIKHQGMATLAVGALVIGVDGLATRDWRRMLKSGITFVAVAVLVALPWYLRSYFMSGGNPVWPLAGEIFGGIEYGRAPTILENMGGSAASTNLVIPTVQWLQHRWAVMSPWSWTFSPPGWQKDIGIYFIAILPGLLLYARSKKVLALMAFCGVYYVVLVRALHMNPRYGLVLFAFLAVLCGYVVQRLCESRLKPISICLQAAFIAVMLLNVTLAFFLSRQMIDVALGRETRAAFLLSHEGNYQAFGFVDKTLPPTAKILLQGIVRGYYLKREYVWDHLKTGVIDYGKHETTDSLLKRFKDLGLTHIVRMITVPKSRLGFYPQYFMDPFQESFRGKHLKTLYYDKQYVVFEINYDA